MWIISCSIFCFIYFDCCVLFVSMLLFLHCFLFLVLSFCFVAHTQLFIIMRAVNATCFLFLCFVVPLFLQFTYFLSLNRLWRIFACWESVFVYRLYNIMCFRRYILYACVCLRFVFYQIDSALKVFDGHLKIPIQLWMIFWKGCKHMYIYMLCIVIDWCHESEKQNIDLHVDSCWITVDLWLFVQ